MTKMFNSSARCASWSPTRQSLGGEGSSKSITLFNSLSSNSDNIWNAILSKLPIPRSGRPGLGIGSFLCLDRNAPGLEVKSEFPRILPTAFVIPTLVLALKCAELSFVTVEKPKALDYITLNELGQAHVFLHRPYAGSAHESPEAGYY